MNKRSYLIAAVNAEVLAKTHIARFEKEFTNGNPNQRRVNPTGGQANNAQGNVPAQQPVQQPVY